MLAEEISALAFPISIAVEIKAIKTSFFITLFITPRIDEKKIMYDDNADPWGWDLEHIGENPVPMTLS